MTIKDLVVEIQMNTEWLETTEGDEVECISIENLEGILNRIFNQKLNLTQTKSKPYVLLTTLR
jgi:hypothetical protein